MKHHLVLKCQIMGLVFGEGITRIDHSKLKCSNLLTRLFMYVRINISCKRQYIIISLLRPYRFCNVLCMVTVNVYMECICDNHRFAQRNMLFIRISHIALL